MLSYFYLTIAILAEVIATSSLKGSKEFTQLLPSILVVVGYLCAFYFLMLSLRTIPIGVAYAVWSGVGIICVALAGYLFFKEALDTAAIVGIGLIITGVLVMKFFSTTTSL